MGLVVLALIVAVLVGAVIAIARRSDVSGGSFWPKSSTGQLAAVGLGVVVLVMVMSMAAW